MPLTVHPVFFPDDNCFILRQSSLLVLEKACSDGLVQLKDWRDANKIRINTNKSYIYYTFLLNKIPHL